MARKKQTFEGSLQRLDEIVSLLEKSEVSLDDSLGLFEEGISLLRYCNTTLENAKLRVEKLSASMENGQEQEKEDGENPVLLED